MYEKYLLEQPKDIEFTMTKNKLASYLKHNIASYSDVSYLYWDKIKYKNIPEHFNNHYELWSSVKFMRNLPYKSPIKNEQGDFFRFGELPFSKKLLHEIDKNASGTIFGNITETEKRLFVTNGMLEEAISSSQLEGASTTVKEAKNMIQKNRKPRNTDERMILNNYEAMNYIKEELVQKELEISDLLYLQSIVTKETLEQRNDVGRLRDDNDDIIVLFEGKISHTPPKREFLDQELQHLVDFANNKSEGTTFIHPIIKAIILHFWIGYLHPFCDGNGRTARAIFYWYLLKNDYFGFSYIPLSRVIKNSKIEYAKSYIYSEQDDLDLTYFINYNLRKIDIALQDFTKEVQQKLSKNKKNIAQLMHLGLNERQTKLLCYFLEHEDSFTTTTTHKNYYNITKSTAISDLKKLQSQGFLYSQKQGRNLHYFPVKNLYEITQK